MKDKPKSRVDLLRRNVEILKRTEEAMVSWLTVMVDTRAELLLEISDPVVLISQTQRINNIRAVVGGLEKVIYDTNVILEIDDAMRRS